ncbi:MAG: replication protein DnaD [Gemmatimonadetes bacterium]|nr:replication protein DnaD [Gemmatimonadota bacterium]
MPFGLGFGETILILAIVLIFFGPRRMPEMGASLGKGIRDFKRALNGLSAELQDGGTPTIHQQPFASPPAAVPPPAVVASPALLSAEVTAMAPGFASEAVVDSVTAPVGQIAADHPTLQRTLHDAPAAEPAGIHAAGEPASLDAGHPVAAPTPGDTALEAAHSGGTPPAA